MRKSSLITTFFAILSFVIILFIFAFSIGYVYGKGDKIGVIEISGIIKESKPIIDDIIRFRKNESIKAVVIRIDSPGGGVGVSQEIYEEVKKLKREYNKKVVVSMGSVAASGGYYIACASDKIVANPGTITGSIGVIAEFFSMEELLDKIGLKGYVVKSGKYKDIGSPFRKMSKEEKALIKNVIDDVHEQFVEAVAEGRNLKKDYVYKIADGRIFSGRQAKKLGLVDYLGNMQDAIDLATKLSKIKGEPEIIYSKKKRSLLDLLIDSIFRNILDKNGLWLKVS
jgi:protease-4